MTIEIEEAPFTAFYTPRHKRLMEEYNKHSEDISIGRRTTLDGALLNSAYESADRMSLARRAYENDIENKAYTHNMGCLPYNDGSGGYTVYTVLPGSPCSDEHMLLYLGSLPDKEGYNSHLECILKEQELSG